jgi:hypothetical protein
MLVIECQALARAVFGGKIRVIAETRELRLACA